MVYLPEFSENLHATGISERGIHVADAAGHFSDHADEEELYERLNIHNPIRSQG